MELLKDGRVIAATPLELPKVAGGRAQHVGKLPIEGLPAGTYQLRDPRDRETTRAVADGVLHREGLT